MADSVYYANPLSSGGDGTGGIDVLTGVTAAFSSLQDAIDTLAGVVLVTDTLTIKCAGTHNTVNITGFTVMGQVFIEGDEFYRHSGVWDDSKFTIASSSPPLTFRDENITVRWAQIEDTAGGSRSFVSFQGGSVNCVVDYCIVRDTTAGGSDTAFTNAASGSESDITNTIVYGFPISFNDASGSGGITRFRNCTFVNNTSEAISDKGNDPLYTNCAFANSVNGITGDSDPLSNYNATTNTTFGDGYDININDLVNQTIEFVDAANNDYRIVSSSPLATAGSDGGPIGAFYEESSGGVTIESTPLSIMTGGYLSTIESLMSGSSTPLSVVQDLRVNNLSSSKTSESPLSQLVSQNKVTSVGVTKSSVSDITGIVSEDNVSGINSSKTSSEGVNTLNSDHKLIGLSTTKTSVSSVDALEVKQTLNTFSPTMTGYSTLDSLSQGLKLGTIQTDFNIALDVYSVRGVGLLGTITTSKSSREALQGVLSGNLSDSISSSKTSLEGLETALVTDSLSSIKTTTTKIEIITPSYQSSYISYIEDYSNTTLSVFSISSVGFLGKIETTKISNETISGLDLNSYLGKVSSSKSSTEVLGSLETKSKVTVLSTQKVSTETLDGLYSSNHVLSLNTTKTVSDTPYAIQVNQELNRILILTGYMPTFSFDDIKTISASVTFSTSVAENGFSVESNTNKFQTINNTQQIEVRSE